ncbi:MAG: DUF1461 domain-containing protein [Clostridia bacterium]|nr:DUF1461 domain-containing protein [Clostridia bacterium]
MKKLAKAAAVIAAVLLLFSLLTGALYRIFTDKDWVRKEYDRLDIRSQTGWSSEYCTFVLTSMMDYSIKARDTLEDVYLPPDYDTEPFFNESELSHMKDVRALTVTVMNLGLAALIIGSLLFVFAVVVLKNKVFIGFSKAFLIALGALLIVVIALGIWIAVDFDSFWTMFHVVFLDLESSTFDPAVSRMIRICPAELFSDFIKHFALIAGLGLLAPVIASVLWLVFRNRITGPRLSVPAIIAFALYLLACIALFAELISGYEPLRLAGFVLLIAASVLNIINLTVERKNREAEEAFRKSLHKEDTK